MSWTRPFITTEHPQALLRLNLAALCMRSSAPGSQPCGTASFDAQGLQTAADKTAAAFVPAWAQKKIIYNPLGGPEAPNAI